MHYSYIYFIFFISISFLFVWQTKSIFRDLCSFVFHFQTITFDNNPVRDVFILLGWVHFNLLIFCLEAIFLMVLCFIIFFLSLEHHIYTFFMSIFSWIFQRKFAFNFRTTSITFRMCDLDAYNGNFSFFVSFFLLNWIPLRCYWIVLTTMRKSCIGIWSTIDWAAWVGYSFAASSCHYAQNSSHNAQHQDETRYWNSNGKTLLRYTQRIVRPL